MKPDINNYEPIQVSDNDVLIQISILTTLANNISNHISTSNEQLILINMYNKLRQKLLRQKRRAKRGKKSRSRVT